jgi:perosamine synthetase
LDRGSFIEQLREAGVGTSVHFIPLHRHPYYQRTYGARPDDFPNAEDAYSRCISLPIYPGLAEHDANRVVHIVAETTRKHRKTKEFVS